MPVRAAKRGNKWVVVDKEGKVHGTHSTKKEAQAQARAINANLHKSAPARARKRLGL